MNDKTGLIAGVPAQPRKAANQAAPFRELDMVRTIRELDSKRGHVDKGTTGTVLLVHGDGEAYEIEFDPHVVMLAKHQDLEPA